MNDDDIIRIAGTFVLENGGPPRGLKWRGCGFEKRGAVARLYCVVLEGYLRQQFPGVLSSKPKKTVIWRNKVLREILSIPQRSKA